MHQHQHRMSLSTAIYALIHATTEQSMTRKELSRLLNRPVTRICHGLVRERLLIPVLISVTTKRGKHKQRRGYAIRQQWEEQEHKLPSRAVPTITETSHNQSAGE